LDPAGSPSPGYLLHRGDALDAYAGWPAPAAIISDGAYGVRGFHGDTIGAEGLPGWYRPHVEAWSRYATPATTLWFWNTELGWATVHPLLAASGWDYVQLITWDKGTAHIAGNVNGRTIRRFPVVTEVCAFYQRRLELSGAEGPLPVQRWLRREWQRSGLALARANEACGVRNAATRKYLTADWLWYWPPGEMVERLAAYANAHGARCGWPYFSLDGRAPVTAKEWDALRYTWRHAHGLTNVWPLAPLHGVERVKGTMRWPSCAASWSRLRAKATWYGSRSVAWRPRRSRPSGLAGSPVSPKPTTTSPRSPLSAWTTPWPAATRSLPNLPARPRARLSAG
jgi:site-specific DNA-methyltransferase (adenine-specific)